MELRKAIKTILVKLSIKFSCTITNRTSIKSPTKNDGENLRERISCFEQKIASRVSSKNFLHTSLYRLYPPSLPVTRYSFVLLLRLRFFSRSLRKVAQFVLLLFDVEAVSELASFFSTKILDVGINEEK